LRWLSIHVRTLKGAYVSLRVNEDIFYIPSSVALSKPIPSNCLVIASAESGEGSKHSFCTGDDVGGNGNTALLKEHVSMGIHGLNDKH
jgi:hypothetical protein